MKKLIISLLLLSLFGCGDRATSIGNTNNPLVVEEEVTPEPVPDTDPQPEPEVEVILQEMASGFCSIDGVVESTNNGFTGDGYANTTNEVGSTIVWQINAQAAGSYSAIIRYAAPSNRPVTITSNNVDTNVEMNSSGDFNSWLTVSTDISLAAGDNNIVLTATTAEGAANIDSIKITGVGLVAGTCMYVAPKAESRAYVIGDSTAANYGSGDYPQKGWGQILQNFFDDAEIEVVNKARGGRSSRNFYNEAGLWDEVLADIEAGDYLLIQFGHNDRDTTAERYTSTTDYESYLAKFVNEAKAKDAIPVLISPMVINAYSNGVLRNVFTESSNDYAGACFGLNRSPISVLSDHRFRD